MSTTTSSSDARALVTALLDGDSVAALSEALALREAGASLEHIVAEGLVVAMEHVDEKCTVEAFNLLEVMLVGRAVSVVAGELFPQGLPADGERAVAVICSPEGDVHDLGKKIVTMVLTGKGHRVVDLGRNCPLDTLLDAAQAEGADAVLVSGLLTTVIPQVRRVRPALIERGLAGVKVVAGGAALKQASAEELGVDFVAESAFDGARYLDALRTKAPS